MSIAKYAEDNEEITLDRIRNRPYDWHLSASHEEYAKRLRCKTDSLHTKGTDEGQCATIR